MSERLRRDTYLTNFEHKLAINMFCQVNITSNRLHVQSFTVFLPPPPLPILCWYLTTSTNYNFQIFNDFCTKLKHLIFPFWYYNEKETGLLKHAEYASNMQNMTNK